MKRLLAACATFVLCVTPRPCVAQPDGSAQLVPEHTEMLSLRQGPLVLNGGAIALDPDPSQQTSFAAQDPPREPAGERRIRFQRDEGVLRIRIDGVHVATYHYDHPTTKRPFFANVYSLSERPVKVSRNFPPVEGVDAVDHAAMHPGIWLAFGDIGGADVWRMKARVEHVEFEDFEAGEERASFTARNRYLDGDRVICEEKCKHTIVRHAGGYLITYDSEFTSDRADFSFGDQEEMGLGIRVASSIAVKAGGSMLNSSGGKDERGTWGQPADWLDYRGVIDGREVGMTLMGHPDNSRRPWFHSRDYGAAVLNPFGRRAMRQGPPSEVVVRRGESLRFRAGVFVHDALGTPRVDLKQAFRAFVESFE